MQDTYWQKLEKCLSRDRLDVYGEIDKPGHRVMTARYLWNIALSESLYAPLHLLEVGLRNAIYEAMVAETGSLTWYNNITLTNYGSSQIRKAEDTLTKRGRPLTPGRVIAELNFGFWTAMFESHFEKPAARFLPHGIKATFPHMPRRRRDRKQIKADLDTIRKLRNRIFHHERIIHWQTLPRQHQLILDFLSGINPDLAELAKIGDSFSSTHADGIQPFLDKLDGHLAALDPEPQSKKTTG